MVCVILESQLVDQSSNMQYLLIFWTMLARWIYLRKAVFIFTSGAGSLYLSASLISIFNNSQDEAISATQRG